MTFFRTLMRPEVLFLLGVLQALLPYAMWYFQGPNLLYDFTPSWTPVILWAVGLFSFCLGARLVPRCVPGTSHCVDSVRFDRLVWCIVGLCVVIIPQIFALILVFGGIPLLAFLDGSMDIADANTMLESASLGQVAVSLMFLYLLNACLMLLTLKALDVRHRWPILGLLLIAGLIEVLGFTVGGKRQGLFMAAFFVLVGFSLRSNDPVGVILRLFGMLSAPTRKAAYIGMAIVGLLSFEMLGRVRSGQEYSLGISEALRYLELPLINLEYQCEFAGYGPNHFEPWAVFRLLLPNRLALIFGDTFRDIETPPRQEPTSQAGFFGELHWRLGLPGIIVGALIAGAISQLCYTRSTQSLFYFLCYCQIAWTLICCHSYNHFLNLVFLPLPAACYLALTFFLGTFGRSRRGVHSQRRALVTTV